MTYLTIISMKTASYLKDSYPKTWNEEKTRDYLVAVKSLDADLTEAELIQMSNLLPQFPVEIHLVSFCSAFSDYLAKFLPMYRLLRNVLSD